MNPLNGLTEYLEHIERRLRMLAVSRGVALAAAAALAFTILGALMANFFAFSPTSVLMARVVLFLALAGALGAGLVVPLLRLNRRRAACEAERLCPQFEQRLVTFAECAEHPDPFLELLAADTLSAAHDAGPERIAPQKRILGFASAGAVALAVLLWLAVSGPGFLGYGTSLLWGAIPRELQPYYEVQVQPGNHTIRRKADQLITARLRAFQTNRVRVFAKFQSSSKWEEASMTPQPGANGFEFLFAGVPEAFDYYVEAAGVRSNRYRIDVADLPEVQKLRVTYHYPSWTELQDTVEDPGGDLRAVEGTEADMKVVTDRPLAAGSLLLDDGSKIELHDGVARVPIQKDGVYHVATAEHGDMVRLSNDYFIEVQKAMPPKVQISRPGRDAKVNPIEEVTVRCRRKMTSHCAAWICTTPSTVVPRRPQPSAAQGKEGGGIDHALPRRPQTHPRRCRQFLRHRSQRHRHQPYRHVLHPGRAFRARLFAIATDGRRRRRRSDAPGFRASERDRRRYLEPGQESSERQGRRGGERQAAGRRPVEAARSGQIAGQPHAGSAT